MFKRLVRNFGRAFGAKSLEDKPPPMVKVWVSIVITFVILGAGLYVILSPAGYDDSVKKWAFGAVGAIIGYWLKD